MTALHLNLLLNVTAKLIDTYEQTRSHFSAEGLFL